MKKVKIVLVALMAAATMSLFTGCGGNTYVVYDNYDTRTEQQVYDEAYAVGYEDGWYQGDADYRAGYGYYDSSAIVYYNSADTTYNTGYEDGYYSGYYNGYYNY